MKCTIHSFFCGVVAIGSLIISGAVRAETIVAVTQYSYDANLRQQCSAVRMNPAVFGSLPSDACTLSTVGSFGADRVTLNQYNAADQVAEIDQAYGTSVQRAYVRYTYSNNGLKQTEKDANGNKTTYVYDGIDRISQVQYPSTSSGSGVSNTSDYQAWTYDNAGNEMSWRHRDGRYTYYGYDALNRETLHYQSDSSIANIYTGYTGLGQVSYHRFGSVSGAGVSYAYDGLGRISSTTDYNNRTISYSYNQASARTQLTLPDMNNVGYGVDNINRLTSIGWNTTSGLVTQTYSNVGFLSGVGRPSAQGTYGYDALGRLMSLNNDLSGTASDVSWTFTYNPAGQVNTSAATSTVYDYKETVNTSDSPSYDGLNRDNRMIPTSAPCPSGGYDTRQNLICDGLTNRNFTYDIDNKLLTAGGSGSGGAITLTYDPEGRLASYTLGGTTTTFLYDGVNLIAEYNGSSSTPLRRYIHGTGTDNPLVWLEGSGTTDQRWLWTDYHGSVIGYSNNTGNLVELYKYGPYGEPKNSLNADSWSGSRFRYTGQTMLYEAKLYYYKARVYDPKWGRFLQTDPIGYKDDMNLYAYVGGDPVNMADPSGLDGNCDIVGPNGAITTRPNCIPDPQAKPETPDEKSKHDKIDEVVVTGFKNKKDKSPPNLPDAVNNNGEVGFIVKDDKLQPATLSVSRNLECKKSHTIVEQHVINRDAFAGADALGHTHGRDIVNGIGPDDIDTARATNLPAYVAYGSGVSVVEQVGGGYRARRVAGSWGSPGHGGVTKMVNAANQSGITRQAEASGCE